MVPTMLTIVISPSLWARLVWARSGLFLRSLLVRVSRLRDYPTDAPAPLDRPMLASRKKGSGPGSAQRHVHAGWVRVNFPHLCSSLLSPRVRVNPKNSPSPTSVPLSSQTVYNTKGTRAHTHRELIRKWLWEPKGSSLEHTHRELIRKWPWEPKGSSLEYI